MFVLSIRLAFADAFDAKIEAILAKSKTVGCAIAFGEKGKVVFAKGYGYANLEHKIKMRPDHVHELASVSKQFTAVAILQLAEKKKLSLDDPISKYFEGANTDWKKVTIRHLLRHVGGVPDYLEAIGDFGQELTRAQIVDSIKSKPLLFEPGTKFEYSNSGYMLLGFIVEIASGMPIGKYIREQLYIPSGMKTAVLNDTRAVVPNRANGYSIQAGKVVIEGFTSSAFSRTGDGEIMASALDMIAWDAALSSGKLLSRASLELMNSQNPALKVEKNGRTETYGFGVEVLRIEGKLIQHHEGGWMGTVTFFARYVSDGKCLAILCNSESAPMNDLLALCEERFLGKKVVSVKE